MCDPSPSPRATAVPVVPVKYDEMHHLFVAKRDREDPQYDSYSLSIEVHVIETMCDLVS